MHELGYLVNYLVDKIAMMHHRWEDWKDCYYIVSKFSISEKRELGFA